MTGTSTKLGIDEVRLRLIDRLQNFSVWKKVKKHVPHKLKFLALCLLRPKGSITLPLENGATFSFDYSDNYWMYYRKAGIKRYEPEIWDVCKQVINKNTIFVDCGANIGLWSIYAGSVIKNANQVIAIEPNHQLLKKLEYNNSQNNNSFTIIEKAIYERSNQVVPFVIRDGHATSNIKGLGMNEQYFKTQNNEGSSVNITTICIDEIVSDAFDTSPTADNVIIKLDVEGAEISAFKGALHTFNTKNTLLMYEDHSFDSQSLATLHFLQNGLHVYCIDENFSTRKINSVDEMVAIKALYAKGYNFFACKPNTGFDNYFINRCT